MKKLSFLLLNVVAASIYLSSCQKDGLTETSTKTVASVTELKNVQVENGMLYFKTGKDFRDAIDLLVKTNTAEGREKLTSVPGFKSQNMLHQEFSEALDKAKTETDVQQILNQNKDIFTEQNGGYYPKVFDKLMTYLINREGLLKVGKALYKFTDWGNIVSRDGNIEDIQHYELTGQISTHLKVFKQKATIASRALCTNFVSAEKQNAEQNRSIEITTSVGFIAYESDPDFPDADWWVKSYISTFCYPEKKNWLGNWVNYKTTNNLSLNYCFAKINTASQTCVVNTSSEYTYSTNYIDTVVDWVLVPQSQVGSHDAEIRSISNNTYSSGGVSPGVTISCQ
jgi:hypothetical protein